MDEAMGTGGHCRELPEKFGSKEEILAVAHLTQQLRAVARQKAKGGREKRRTETGSKTHP